MTQAGVAEVVRAARPRHLRAKRRSLGPFLPEIVSVLEREGELNLRHR